MATPLGGRIPSSHPGNTTQRAPGLLCARALRAGYESTNVLLGVDLDVEPGEFVALVGPSGSGKSTLLYCLAGIHRAASGTISFSGREITKMNECELSDLRRRDFGFVLQFGRLVADLTVVENVSLPLRLNGVRRREAEDRAGALLAEVGLSRRANRRASTLSGGEQQRAAVARSLIHKPAVVFADEPTGALDSTNGAVVLELLTRAARERRAALIIVTHDERIAQQADRIVSMKDGRLSLRGRKRSV